MSRLAKGQPFWLQRNEPVPSYLSSTFDMITAAYPDGMSASHPDYLALLSVLEPEMSFRNLATAMCCAFDLEYAFVINEVYRVAGQPESEAEQSRVVSRLKKFGFEQWREEP